MKKTAAPLRRASLSNIQWHLSKVSRHERENIKYHRSACLWFTGLSGSGKSTIANDLEVVLNTLGVHTYLLDGDNIRHGLNKDLTFSNEDRCENIRRIGEVANLFVDAGIIVLSAFISPFSRDRDYVRNLLPKGCFIEIFVDVSIETCELRDPKGLYKKARSGEIKDFTGIASSYEIPLAPEITIFNDDSSQVSEHVSTILNYLENNQIISREKRASS